MLMEQQAFYPDGRAIYDKDYNLPFKKGANDQPTHSNEKEELDENGIGKFSGIGNTTQSHSFNHFE